MSLIYKFQFLIPVCIILTGHPVNSQITILNKPSDLVVIFGNGKLKMVLDYDKKCIVTKLEVNGERVVSEKAGIFSQIRTLKATSSTCRLDVAPTIMTTKNQVKLSQPTTATLQALFLFKVLNAKHLTVLPW